ncbi:MAG: LPS export ABC transporter permease LptF [Zoogloeaceae bacterium]|jgi:lipopolysaccharide export system permease protein|nr:LPS export ABC transporter permease LptF [Zoogloeaceae bacterium]
MIFERAARREFTHAAAGIFVALFAILVSTQLVRLLNEAAGGKLELEAVVALLGFSALNYLPTLLSLTLFMSVLLPLSRAYRDSEMVVWFSSGLALTAWLRPVLRFALPLTLAIAVLSLFLSPWAISRSSQYRHQVEAKSRSTPISPGAFREISNGDRVDRVVFVEKLAEDAGAFTNVFVSSMQEGRLGIVMADSGTQETMDNGDRFLMLGRGQRYEIEPGSPEFRVMEFERYGVRVEEARAEIEEEPPRAQPIWQLSISASPREAGEILWRIGQPVAALLLAFLAVPLSFANPRAGRSLNMLFALIVFTLYNNLLSVSQAWVTREIASFPTALLVPHLFMLVVLAALFYRRLAVFLPLAFLRRARTQSA